MSQSTTTNVSKNTQYACYALIASALLLSGMLLAQISLQPNQAEAALVIKADNFTVLTARTADDEEALFILDNISQRILIYTQDITRKRIELVGSANLGQMFGGGGGGGGGAR